MTGDPAYARPGDDPTGQPVPVPGPAPSAGMEPPAAPATTPPAGPQAAPPAPPAPPAASPTTPPAGREAAPLPQHTLDRTRTGGLWVAATSAVVVILLLLIFILQNGEQVEVSLFGANPDLPLGVALLLAAVLGALFVALVGIARVVQLRLTAKRHRAEDQATRRSTRR